METGMSNTKYAFESLSTKEGFNRSLSHFRSVSSLLDDFEGHTNLADLLNNLLNGKEITHDQVLPIINALLVDKYAYTCRSISLSRTVEDFSTLVDEVKSWKAVDLVFLFHHPDLGHLAINPKHMDHFSGLNNMMRNELLTVYAGAFEKQTNTVLLKKALDSLEKILSGSNAKIDDALKKGTFGASKRQSREKEQVSVKKASAGKSRGRTAKAVSDAERAKVPEKRVETPSQSVAVDNTVPRKRRMTPFYSVPVTNELFHNGNVEAWKRIIQSYNTKHPDLEVYIYYDNERIHDIHSLFKWGKVKHGSAILFAVAGEEIKDVAKLQRYLKQGASPKFEDFLKFPISQILNLF